MAKIAKLVIGIFLVGTVFSLSVYLIRGIEGGADVFQDVAGVMRNNSCVQGIVGSPLLVIERNDGASEVNIRRDGLRGGYYSVNVRGAIKSVKLKVEWREAQKGKYDIISIYKTEDFRADEKIWPNDISGTQSRP